jgi:hypothetical protein
MNRRSKQAVSLVALVVASACGTMACSSSSSTPATGPAGQETTGAIGAQLQIGGNITINTATYVITGPNGFTVTGPVDLSHSSGLSFTVGGLPAGSGYSLVLTATATDGVTTCAGSATFSIAAGMTTSVTVHLDCHEPPSTGTVSINGVTNVCPTIDAVSATPNQVNVGSALSVTGAAHDPDNGPSPLSYAWTSTSGTFSSASTPNTSFTCTTAGSVTLTLTVSDGDTTAGCPAVSTTTITCTTAGDAGVTVDSGSAPVDSGSAPVDSGASDAATVAPQALVTTVAPGVFPMQALINQGTAIGEGALNGATPFMVNNLAADPNNTQTIATNDGGPPFLASGNVPDPAFGFCNYPTDGGAPTRITHVTGSKFEAAQTDPMVPLTPAYFPLTYFTANTPSGNAFGGKAPIIGLFDWRPKDIDESVLAAESDDDGQTWYFMQNVLELDPDFTNPISGGFSPTSTNTGCPATVNDTNANFVSANGSQDDDGWGHAAIVQLPGPSKLNQFLYLLDRNTNNIPGTSTEIVDGAPLWVISLNTSTANGGSSNKFPIWNTNFTAPGNNDMKSIASVLNQTPDSGAPIEVTQTVGLTDPDGIMAVFPTPAPVVNTAGTPVTVLWVQKILNGDNTGSTALPVSQQCTKAPFSGKTNHDIATVRLATTVDGIHFNDLGPVNGLSDPTTVDYTQTRWVSPRGTLIDIHGDGSRWGLYFSAGNCLDGDSDAFHYIGYAESSDMMNWTVYNGINNPIASINPVTAKNQATGQTVTVPANPPLIPTQSWFAERLYAPTAIQIDPTHLSLTFAGYGVQTPNNDLLDYRAIGNIVLTVSEPLPAGTPNNINAH